MNAKDIQRIRAAILEGFREAEESNEPPDISGVWCAIERCVFPKLRELELGWVDIHLGGQVGQRFDGKIMISVLIEHLNHSDSSGKQTTKVVMRRTASTKVVTWE